MKVAPQYNLKIFKEMEEANYFIREWEGGGKDHYAFYDWIRKDREYKVYFYKYSYGGGNESNNYKNN
jgi:hypothetical protein